MCDPIFLKDKKLLDSTNVENMFIAHFMPAAPELAVKAYLYGLMLVSGAETGDTDIASALGCCDTDIRAAFAYWQSAGLVEIISEEPLQICYRSVKEALSRGALDTSGAVYGEFVRRIQEAAGTRIITGAELKKLYDWLDVYGFEQDAAVELFRCCLDLKGARTNVSYMDAVARTLAGKGALTADAVREHFAEETLLKSGAARILRSWNIRANPTEAQLALYEKWTKAWGFDEAAIDIALTKMTSAERMSFNYLDKILCEWHEKGAIDIDSARERLRQEDAMAELTRQVFVRAGLASKPASEQKLLIEDWNLNKHIDAEIILLAADLSKGATRQFVSVRKLVNEWYEHGISSASEAKAYYEAGKNSAPAKRGKPGRSMNYMHGEIYSREDLKKMGITLGEEIYDHDEQ